MSSSDKLTPKYTCMIPFRPVLQISTAVSKTHTVNDSYTYAKAGRAYLQCNGCRLLSGDRLPHFKGSGPAKQVEQNYKHGMNVYTCSSSADVVC